MEEYKRLDRTLVHQGKITTTYTDRILLPNGNEADWDFIGHHGRNFGWKNINGITVS